MLQAEAVQINTATLELAGNIGLGGTGKTEVATGEV